MCFDSIITLVTYLISHFTMTEYFDSLYKRVIVTARASSVVMRHCIDDNASYWSDKLSTKIRDRAAHLAKEVDWFNPGINLFVGYIDEGRAAPLTPASNLTGLKGGALPDEKAYPIYVTLSFWRCKSAPDGPLMLTYEASGRYADSVKMKEFVRKLCPATSNVFECDREEQMLPAAFHLFERVINE